MVERCSNRRLLCFVQKLTQIGDLLLGVGGLVSDLLLGVGGLISEMLLHPPLKVPFQGSESRVGGGNVSQIT